MAQKHDLCQCFPGVHFHKEYPISAEVFLLLTQGDRSSQKLKRELHQLVKLLVTDLSAGPSSGNLAKLQALDNHTKALEMTLGHTQKQLQQQAMELQEKTEELQLVQRQLERAQAESEQVRKDAEAEEAQWQQRISALALEATQLQTHLLPEISTTSMIEDLHQTTVPTTAQQDHMKAFVARISSPGVLLRTDAVKPEALNLHYSLMGQVPWKITDMPLSADHFLGDDCCGYNTEKAPAPGTPAGLAAPVWLRYCGHCHKVGLAAEQQADDDFALMDLTLPPTWGRPLPGYWLQDQYWLWLVGLGPFPAPAIWPLPCLAAPEETSSSTSPYLRLSSGMLQGLAYAIKQLPALSTFKQLMDALGQHFLWLIITPEIASQIGQEQAQPARKVFPSRKPCVHNPAKICKKTLAATDYFGDEEQKHLCLWFEICPDCGAWGLDPSCYEVLLFTPQDKLAATWNLLLQLPYSTLKANYHMGMLFDQSLFEVLQKVQQRFQQASVQLTSHIRNFLPVVLHFSLQLMLEASTVSLAADTPQSFCTSKLINYIWSLLYEVVKRRPVLGKEDNCLILLEQLRDMSFGDLMQQVGAAKAYVEQELWFRKETSTPRLAYLHILQVAYDHLASSLYQKPVEMKLSTTETGKTKKKFSSRGNFKRTKSQEETMSHGEPMSQGDLSTILRIPTSSPSNSTSDLSFSQLELNESMSFAWEDQDTISFLNE